ncbi:PAS domain-containing sensor histidine kinase [Cryomorphaceae bacterium]|nr:PAS domain-containing sensor histidine kinase [Cryomorphaceae bacterium]
MNNHEQPNLEARVQELERQNQILKEQLKLNEEERNDFLTNTLNTMGDPVFVKDSESRLLLVNDAFCEMFHMSRSECIGKTLAENVPPEERDSFLAIDRQVIADGIENVNEETLTVNENETRIIATKKSRFIGPSGNKYLVGIIRDLTERIRSEEALKESEQQLKELNATKDKMFSIISHDLRSPINSMMGLSELLTNKQIVVTPEDEQEYMAMIHTSIINTSRLLDNLLGWAKSQSGQIEVHRTSFNFLNAVEEVLSISRTSAKVKGIELRAAHLVDVQLCTDRNMLETIMLNLVSNSIKFTQSGGSITLSSEKSATELRVTITDTGLGMSEEQSDSLFAHGINKSVRGTANEKGSGLGLMLCQDFIDRLGGTIGVQSVLGEGSSFTFHLPISGEAECER